MKNRIMGQDATAFACHDSVPHDSVLVFLCGLRGYSERKPTESSRFLVFIRIFERWLGIAYIRFQPSHHLLDRRDLYPGLARRCVVFVIPTQPPAPTEPGV